MTLKRILGAEMVFVGLLGLSLSLVGIIYGHRMIDRIGSGLRSDLELASQTLDAAKETLVLAKTTLGQAYEGLDTIETTAIDASKATGEIRPLLGDIAQVVSRDVPSSMEGFQAAVSDIAQAAATIDDALAGLSDLSVEQEISGFPVRLELNLGYAPEVPFEESVSRIGSSVEGIPSQLRDLEVRFGTADGNLEAISQDLLAVSDDVDVISNRVAEVTPLLDEYIRIVTEVNHSVRQTQASLSRHLATAKLAVTLALVWMGLMQVAPLYLGWELVTGQRGAR